MEFHLAPFLEVRFLFVFLTIIALAYLHQPINNQLEDRDDDDELNHFEAPNTPQLFEEPGRCEEQVD